MKPVIVKTTDADRELPWKKCLCGGKYCLYVDEQERQILTHTIPWCDRYEVIEDTKQAVAFSQANRGVS